MLQLDSASALPLWRQIEDGVRTLVATRALPPGVCLPSVRELARELQVNPATVSKAYQRLAEAGVLEVRRGEGTFVTSDPPSMPAGERRRRLERAARGYAVAASTLGAEVEEALEVVRSSLARVIEGAPDD